MKPYPATHGWLTNGHKVAGPLGAMGCQRCIQGGLIGMGLGTGASVQWGPRLVYNIQLRVCPKGQ